MRRMRQLVEREVRVEQQQVHLTGGEGTKGEQARRRARPVGPYQGARTAPDIGTREI